MNMILSLLNKHTIQLIVFITAVFLLATEVNGQSEQYASSKSYSLTSCNESNWQMIKNDLLKESLSEVSMPSCKTEDWQKAIVPGTVLNSLVANGEFPEPYFRMNNKITKNIIPDISKVGREYYHYVFRKEFNIPEEMQNDVIWLKFHGINYFSKIWLNGNYVGEIKGMFNPKTFNVTDHVSFNDKNVLVVDIEPVEHPGKTKPAINKKNVVEKENRNGGNGDIGQDVTMLMSIGWDFTFADGIRDRNTGIWRDVEIYSTGKVDLRNVFVRTDLEIPDTTVSYQTVIVDVVNESAKEQKGEVRVSIPEYDVSIIQKVEIDPKSESTITFSHEDYKELIFKNPKLWWAFNKGAQNLTTISVEYKNSDGSIDDIEETHFGIRKITSDCNTPDGSRVFYVNGKRMFVRGSNWIPEGMLRTSDARTKTELEYTKQVGINFLRLWGGGISESDYFFSLCDSLGILVWHEFWMTGDTKPPADKDLYYENITSTIKRIRNHPSLAYYVSSNEQKNVIHIKPLLDELDGTRGYQQESECCGVHDGSPYKFENPMQYFDNTASSRGSRIDGFCPEYGTVCLPSLDFLKTIMNAEDIYPPNKEVWDYLDGNGFHYMTTKYLDAISLYGEAKGINDFVRKGEMVGATAYKALWENWNYNKFEYDERFASGVLFWYHNSPVNQVCGRLWDWSLEPTAAYYSTKKALEPLHVQYDYLKNSVSVINEYPKSFDGIKVKAEVYGFNSKLVLSEEQEVNISAEEVLNDVISISFPDDISQIHFVVLTLTDKNNKVVSENFYWRSNDEYEGPWTTTGPIYSGFEDFNNMPRTSVEIKTEKIDENTLIINVVNKGEDIAMFLKLKVVDSENNVLRQAVYDDNYFSILPRKSKSVKISLDLTGKNSDTLKVIAEGLNL